MHRQIRNRVAACSLAALMAVGLLAPAALAEPAKNKTDKTATDKAATDKPADKSSTAKSTDKSAKPAKGDNGLPPELQDAIKTLSAEMESVIKSPSGTRRTDADYFKEHPLQLDQGKLIELLGKPLNRDPRVDAYVKWQILGGVSEPFDAQHVNKALQAYTRLPVPPSAPGVNARDQQQLNQATQRLKQDGVDELNVKWQDRMNQNLMLVEPMLKLRDMMYQHLPSTGQKINAGMQDAQVRLSAGYETTLVASILGDARSLAAGLKPNEINQLAATLRGYAGQEGPSIYTDVKWNEKKRAAEWTAKKLTFNKKTIEETVTDLAKMAKL